jgi:hypothetical protein
MCQRSPRLGAALPVCPGPWLTTGAHWYSYPACCTPPETLQLWASTALDDTRTCGLVPAMRSISVSAMRTSSSAPMMSITPPRSSVRTSNRGPFPCSMLPTVSFSQTTRTLGPAHGVIGRSKLLLRSCKPKTPKTAVAPSVPLSLGQEPYRSWLGPDAREVP